MQRLFIAIALILLNISLLHCQETTTTVRTTRTTTKRRPLFVYPCGDVGFYATFYIGECPLERENLYPKMTGIVDFIKNSNQEIELYDFIKNYLFANATFYFRDNYKTHPNYNQYLRTLDGNLFFIHSLLDY